MPEPDGLLPKFMAKLLGRAWGITLLGWAYCLLSGLEAAPNIIEHWPGTTDDWFKLTKGILVAAFTRFAGEGRYKPPSGYKVIKDESSDETPEIK